MDALMGSKDSSLRRMTQENTTTQRLRGIVLFPGVFMNRCRCRNRDEAECLRRTKRKRKRFLWWGIAKQRKSAAIVDSFGFFVLWRNEVSIFAPSMRCSHCSVLLFRCWERQGRLGALSNQ